MRGEEEERRGREERKKKVTKMRTKYSKNQCTHVHVYVQHKNVRRKKKRIKILYILFPIQLLSL